MAVEVYTAEELRRRTLNRIDGKAAHGGVEHCQVGTCTLNIDAEHVAQFKLQQTLDRFIRGYVKQHNADKRNGNRMIGARVIGVEIQRLYEA